MFLSFCVGNTEGNTDTEPFSATFPERLTLKQLPQNLCTLSIQKKTIMLCALFFLPFSSVVKAYSDSQLPFI